MKLNLRYAHITKDLLDLECKTCHSWKELTKRLGFNANCYRTCKKIKKLVQEFKINTDHFDSNFSTRQRDYPRREKECPICKLKFITKIGASDEKTYCSRKCANNIPNHNRFSEESRKKISKTTTHSPVIKICEHCDQTYQVLFQKRKKRRFCSQSCASAYQWTPLKRKEQSRRCKERIRKEEFGWVARNKLSFPEKVYKDFLEKNGFKDRFFMNFSIAKLNFKNIKNNYFLDIYFPEFNLNIEIDGQQHKTIKERRESDKKRDKFLLKNGIIIYRIDWKEICSDKGKKYLKECQDNLINFLLAISSKIEPSTDN